MSTEPDRGGGTHCACRVMRRTWHKDRPTLKVGDKGTSMRRVEGSGDRFPLYALYHLTLLALAAL
jgi:hypothetical protein